MNSPALARSLQFRLVWRLGLVFALATAMAVAFLVYQNYDTAVSLGNRQLSLRAEDLARAINIDASGRAGLTLPPKLAAQYAASPDSDLFAIQTSDGRVIAASPDAFGNQVAGWTRPTRQPDFFHVQEFGLHRGEYYGLTAVFDSSAGPVSITVAHAAEVSQLIHSLLLGFVVHIGWLIPIFVTATLVIGVFAIRSGLRPVLETSRQASTIGPSTTSIRLPESRVPTEIFPLVSAINRALDRLEQGFVIQRQFTANAAHELRTPLAIITGALEAIKGDGQMSNLQKDVARMNRIVNQLLRAAQLDAAGLDTSATVDLNEIAATVASDMAPWAIKQSRRIGFEGTNEPVPIQGNADAMEDALRNVIENAVAYSPPGEEVTVTVKRDGSVTVADRGRGIAPQDRERIFDRFWRAKDSAIGGAGLGLAIVHEIMKAHRGEVTVADNVPSGCIFRLAFALRAERKDGSIVAAAVDASALPGS